MPDKVVFIEEKIINAVKKLLVGRVNELLEALAWEIPLIEFSDAFPGGPYSITPDITLSAGERSEKDRIIKIDSHTLTIRFTIPEKNGETNGYVYAAAVEKALVEDPTLGGAADRAALLKKSYVPPKTPRCGEPWETLLTLRIATEGMTV